MKMRLATRQRGSRPKAQPLWLRALAMLCLGLISLASTAQVCHSHVDAFEASLLQPDSGAAAHTNPSQPARPGVPDTGVSCPLCVAMHSALPVAESLPQVALLELAAVAPRAEGIDRRFSWRFEMASRPPPAPASRA